ncbi:hypothetical protein P7H09_01755 [Paenibacillus larvae]|uniref:Uncharacterized protein n=1 Tax=Paenibacillus larvae TaxID=1464 RepID=A0AAP5JQL1_9BACL|nr:hypothetical protein [Paenibacillus larvae]MDT2250132.1 hypothetical protein [Paenibacillus larvae]
MGTKWCKTVIGGGILLAAAVFPIIFLCQEKENVQHKPGVSPDDSPLYSFVSRHLMSDDGGYTQICVRIYSSSRIRQEIMTSFPNLPDYLWSMHF